MDYSKLSDNKINAEVALHWLGKGNFGLMNGAVETFGGSFDPCNNPADAWSIILDNGISLLNVWDEGGESIDDSTWAATTNIDMTWCGGRERGFESTDKNPLRAAMIVYLMMREGE